MLLVKKFGRESRTKVARHIAFEYVIHILYVRKNIETARIKRSFYDISGIVTV